VTFSLHNSSCRRLLLNRSREHSSGGSRCGALDKVQLTY